MLVVGEPIHYSPLTIHHLHSVDHSLPYSVRNDFTGLASADLIALCPAVIQAITIEPAIANKNIDALNGIR
jgi:hypothetical protein